MKAQDPINYKYQFFLKLLRLKPMHTEPGHRLINNDLFKKVGAVACGVACIQKMCVADVF